jgi:hypothetical protein
MKVGKMFKWLTNRKKTQSVEQKTEKQIATEKGLPYIKIISFEIDSKNLHTGSFELDWNDKFIADLIRAGYQIKREDSEADIVDRWFQNVCRHVVMETWEQEQAIANNWTKVRDLGDGRSEIS